jgi:hypothetical protein
MSVNTRINGFSTSSTSFFKPLSSAESAAACPAAAFFVDPLAGDDGAFVKTQVLYDGRVSDRLIAAVGFRSPRTLLAHGSFGEALRARAGVGANACDATTTSRRLRRPPRRARPARSRS